ncbi:MAG: hypothetical protein AAFX50_02545 [Acidobacteriota bacterium]
MATKTIERQLHRLRLRIAEVSHISGHLAENFAPLEALADDILAVLARDAPGAGRQVRRLVDSERCAFDRVLALEGGLARAVEYDRALESPPDADELRHLVDRRHLDFSNELRVLYAFSIDGGTAWDQLEALPPAEDPPPTLNPVIRALRTLARDDRASLRSSHRLAAEQARRAPLGFAALVVEEALSILRAADFPVFAQLTYVGELLTDPFLAALAPRVHADLLARAALHLAEHHALGPASGEHPHWLDRGAALLGEGTGSAELQAIFFEARAMQSVHDGHIPSALRDLLRANVLLADFRPVDRRAETLLRYALVLAHHPGASRQAPLVLESALAMLAELELEVQPALRLRLRHFLGDILVRLVYSYASELEPLPQGERIPHPGELERRVRRWADALAARQPQLRSATMHIRAAEDLYANHGTERLRAHRGWIIGRALLTATPELASIYLQDAHDAFLRLDDTARARGTLRHVAICHALLGRRTESIQALGSLDLLASSPEADGRARAASPELADLTLLLHDLLPEAEGRRGEDAVLADVLELPAGRRAAG